MRPRRKPKRYPRIPREWPSFLLDLAAVVAAHVPIRSADGVIWVRA